MDDTSLLLIEGKGSHGIELDLFSLSSRFYIFMCRAVVHDTLLHILITPAFHGTPICIVLSGAHFLGI